MIGLSHGSRGDDDDDDGDDDGGGGDDDDDDDDDGYDTEFRSKPSSMETAVNTLCTSRIRPSASRRQRCDDDDDHHCYHHRSSDYHHYHYHHHHPETLTIVLMTRRLKRVILLLYEQTHGRHLGCALSWAVRPASVVKDDGPHVVLGEYCYGCPTPEPGVHNKPRRMQNAPGL